MSQKNEIPSSDDTEAVPVLEEKLSIHRREVETGRLRVRLRTETEETQLHADLRSEAIEVERIPIGRQLAEGEVPPGPREEDEGRVLVIPVFEEVLVVEKRLVLREEIRLHRTSASESVETPVTLRRQHAEIERLPPRTTE
ncbi:YsnF/AvaK domain-containing protein [Belnapia sp. F-4-1]|uniref:YsnF/AvaK domain-containing protein n=1 Tax=Belnapia sp. F-4-1 TaxID=1545443 RepID=UPI0005BC3F2E|nr:YsnF/AvaK domain-containing protein [Belnapia sp. F-4-1]